MLNSQQLTALESTPAIKEKYLKSAAFGKNKAIYPFLLIGILCLAAVAFLVFTGMTETVGVPLLAGVGIAGVASLVVMMAINNKTTAKLQQETNEMPVCIGKKIYGNDNTQIYYGIYTTGPKRHDADFINRIAGKIFNIAAEPDKDIAKKVNRLFAVEFAAPNEFAKPLPAEFTEGELVYRKQFAFLHLPEAVKTKIADNDNVFLLVALNAENPKIITDDIYYNP